MMIFTLIDLIFGWEILVHILQFLLEQKYGKLFKFLTCNSWKAKDFREKYMSEYNDKHDEEDVKDKVTLNLKLAHKVIVEKADGKDKDGKGKGSERLDSSMRSRGSHRLEMSNNKIHSHIVNPDDVSVQLEDSN